MGYDVCRFVDLGDLGGELLCCICLGIFEEPYMLTRCGHCFCKKCIFQWLSERRTCPVDGSYLCLRSEPLPAPHVIKNIIAKQKIHCEFQERGCEEICTLERLVDHHRICAHRPMKILKYPTWSYFSRLISSFFTKREVNHDQAARGGSDETFLDRLYQQRRLSAGAREQPAELVDENDTFEPHIKWIITIGVLIAVIYLWRNTETTLLTFYYDNELTCWLTLLAALAVWRNHRNDEGVAV